MKSSTITHQNIFVIDGQEYWFTSTGAKGLIVTATTPPHAVRAISNDDFADLLPDDPNLLAWELTNR